MIIVERMLQVYIDDNLDWAVAVPAVAAAAEAVPAEAAAEVVQHDAKAQSLHAPICPICLEAA